jgi:putative PIN family toxin of toxin-antitoxin system
VRVFLDTNVLVSAFATRGLCADVFRTVLAEHDLIVGEVVLEELERVLTTRFSVPGSTVAEVLGLLREQEVVARPARPADVSIADPDDAWVLASAQLGKVQFLVTGDQDLLELGKIEDLEILTPRGFWERLRAGVDQG